MIFYFSGTGNSFYAAKKMADATGERLISISRALKKNNFPMSWLTMKKLAL